MLLPAAAACRCDAAARLPPPPQLFCAKATPVPLHLAPAWGQCTTAAFPSFPTLCTQGVDLTDEELIDHISEMCVMSKSMEEYEGVPGGRGGSGVGTGCRT